MYLEFPIRNKEIKFVKTKEGDYKKKVGNKETHKLEETNELHHGKVTNFSISLGKKGHENLGGIAVEYWGDQPIIEGKGINKGSCYLKQKTGTIKDPKTFVEKKMSQVVLMLIGYDKLNDADKEAKYKEVKNPTPEKSIELGLKEYKENNAKIDELVDVNEAFNEKKVEL